MSDSTEKVEVTREELDALKSTAKTAERTAKIVGLSAEHRTHFDSLSDEASQDAFLDLDETKRSEAVAEANKPAPTDENAVLRAEVATLREQVANSDLVNRANSEMASIEASQDLKVAILRFKDTLSDDAKTEFDGILNRSVGKTADRTAPKGEGVRSEISGLTLDKAVARAKDNDLTGAEAMEIANREVDRLHGEALVKGETNHHGMPLTRAEVYARFVDAYPDLKAAINK